MEAWKWDQVSLLIIILQVFAISDSTHGGGIWKRDTAENPEHDRDPAGKSNDKNNLIIGFFAFKSGASSVTEEQKALLRKIIERSDLMMVANIPKSIELFPEGTPNGRAKRSTGASDVTPAIFYDERIITVEKYQLISDPEFNECPPAAAIMKHLNRPDDPPVGLLMLYGVQKQLPGASLSKIYERAHKLLQTDNIIIAGDINVERPEGPEAQPGKIPWYNGHAYNDIATAGDCFCPWVCPCIRFKYLVSVSGECSQCGGAAPYTKGFMWLQQEEEEGGTSSAGLSDAPYGKLIIGGKWLQGRAYAGTGRIHVLDVTYKISKEDQQTLPIEYPVEVVLKPDCVGCCEKFGKNNCGGEGGSGAGGGSGSGGTGEGPGEGGSAGGGGGPGGSGGSSGDEYMMHISSALGQTMCKNYQENKLGKLKMKHSAAQDSSCWYGRTCKGAGSCESFSEHSC